MMIEGVELNFYFDDGTDMSMPLNSTQTEVILKALGMKIAFENGEQIAISHFGDDTLKKHILPKINFKPI